MNAIPAVQEAQTVLFDYSALDQEKQILIRMRASEIKTLGKRMAQDAVEIGGKLAEVKDLLGGNGKFVEWLERELHWSERSAYNFIAVHEKFSGANFALENVAPSALYLLAASSTPPEAIEAVKQIADSGEEVSHGTAKEIVRQAKATRAKRQPTLTGDDELRSEADQAEVEAENERFNAEDGRVAEEQNTIGEGPDEVKELKPAARPTTDKLKTESEIEKLFGKTKIEISLTLMPSDGNKAGRMIVGSINAQNCQSLFFNGRGFEDFTLSKLEEALTQFKRELPQRQNKTGTKAAVGKSGSKSAAKSSAKPGAKASGKTSTKSAKSRSKK